MSVGNAGDITKGNNVVGLRDCSVDSFLFYLQLYRGVELSLLPSLRNALVRKRLPQDYNSRSGK